jgi:hypothetical protein
MEQSYRLDLSLQNAAWGGSGQCLDIGRAHSGRVTDAVEAGISFDPVDIGFFGASGIMFEADGLAHLTEKFLVGLRHDPSGGWEN